MDKPKAKLRNTAQEVDSTSEKPKLNLPGVQDIVELKEESWVSIIWGWVKSILLFAIFTCILLSLVYTALAGTIIFLANAGVSSSGHPQPALVVRGTFIGGTATKNSHLYISGSEVNPENFLNNVKVGFVGAPNAATVVVRSNQFDNISINGNVASIESQVVPGKLVGPYSKTGVTEHRLNNEYLVECVSGGCTKGTLFIISKSLVYGEVKNSSH